GFGGVGPGVADEDVVEAARGELGAGVEPGVHRAVAEDHGLDDGEFGGVNVKAGGEGGQGRGGADDVEVAGDDAQGRVELTHRGAHGAVDGVGLGDAAQVLGAAGGAAA